MEKVSFALQVGQQVTQQVGALLEVMHPGKDYTRMELMEILQLKDRNNFTANYLNQALAAGCIEMTIPEKPQSRLQKYRLKLHKNQAET